MLIKPEQQQTTRYPSFSSSSNPRDCNLRYPERASSTAPRVRANLGGSRTTTPNFLPDSLRRASSANASPFEIRFPDHWSARFAAPVRGRPRIGQVPKQRWLPPGMRGGQSPRCSKRHRAWSGPWQGLHKAPVIPLVQVKSGLLSLSQVDPVIQPAFLDSNRTGRFFAHQGTILKFQALHGSDSFFGPEVNSTRLHEFDECFGDPTPPLRHAKRRELNHQPLTKAVNRQPDRPSPSLLTRRQAPSGSSNPKSRRKVMACWIFSRKKSRSTPLSGFQE